MAAGSGMASTRQILVEAVAHSKFKIEWAKNHINGIKYLVDQIAAENTDIITIDNNSHPATVLIGPKNFIPAALVLHLGDAVHGLNSVMDFLWSGLARSCNPCLASKVTFPRDETWENLRARLDDPKGYHAAIHKAFPKAKLFVLDVVKPYNRGDGDPSLIWNLNKIDNINKHRMLIVATHAISFDRGFALVGSDGGTIVHAADAAIQTQGYPMTIGLTPPVQTHDKPKATVTVVFGEPNHFRAQPVLETLVNLTDATCEVVKAFEKAFL
jgi:hypothetical protein